MNIFPKIVYRTLYKLRFVLATIVLVAGVYGFIIYPSFHLVWFFLWMVSGDVFTYYVLRRKFVK